MARYSPVKGPEAPQNWVQHRITTLCEFRADVQRNLHGVGLRLCNVATTFGLCVCVFAGAKSQYFLGGERRRGKETQGIGTWTHSPCTYWHHYWAHLSSLSFLGAPLQLWYPTPVTNMISNTAATLISNTCVLIYTVSRVLGECSEQLQGMSFFFLLRTIIYQ